jgi:hypothetical protein
VIMPKALDERLNGIRSDAPRMTRWSCEMLVGVGRRGPRTRLRLPACAATGRAGGKRGQAASHVGVWSVYTRADAVNECPPDGGCHCHVARCPFPLVARLLLTVCPASHAME